MNMIKIQKQDWEKGLEKLKSGYELFGPVVDKDAWEFRKLEPDQLPVLGMANTRLSAKSTVFPQSQVMFRYSLEPSKEDSGGMQAEGLDVKPRAVLGIRPCDAASFQLVKKNFDNREYPDPYWVKPFEQTTFIGFACDQPLQTCFCTSVGGGPYGEAGLDLLFSENGDHFIAKALTEKGDILAKAAGWQTEGDAAELEAKRVAAEKKISTTVATDRIKTSSVLDLFNAPFWEEIAFACLNCGTCTFSCPTCWCFDIQDEVKGTEGKRMRNWDSCMFPLFTLEGSGHNPRPKKEQRVRQRFMHKLKYYPDKYGSDVQCVGCGRCIQLCPVNIDIRQVCESMNNL
ncbi:4Fe-4S dicluster domain-containing protein [bacterium]|nr:4Fe-4S dicluster domain-containing protein [bacterium]